MTMSCHNALIVCLLFCGGVLSSTQSNDLLENASGGIGPDVWPRRCVCDVDLLPQPPSPTSPPAPGVDATTLEPPPEWNVTASPVPASEWNATTNGTTAVPVPVPAVGGAVVDGNGEDRGDSENGTDTANATLLNESNFNASTSITTGDSETPGAVTASPATASVTDPTISATDPPAAPDNGNGEGNGDGDGDELSPPETNAPDTNATFAPTPMPTCHDVGNNGTANNGTDIVDGGNSTCTTAPAPTAVPSPAPSPMPTEGVVLPPTVMDQCAAVSNATVAWCSAPPIEFFDDVRGLFIFRGLNASTVFLQLQAFQANFTRDLAQAVNIAKKRIIIDCVQSVLPDGTDEVAKPRIESVEEDSHIAVNFSLVWGCSNDKSPWEAKDQIEEAFHNENSTLRRTETFAKAVEVTFEPRRVGGSGPLTRRAAVVIAIGVGAVAIVVLIIFYACFRRKKDVAISAADMDEMEIHGSSSKLEQPYHPPTSVELAQKQKRGEASSSASTNSSENLSEFEDIELEKHIDRQKSPSPNTSTAAVDERYRVASVDATDASDTKVDVGDEPQHQRSLAVSTNVVDSGRRSPRLSTDVVVKNWLSNMRRTMRQSGAVIRGSRGAARISHLSNIRSSLAVIQEEPEGRGLRLTWFAICAAFRNALHRGGNNRRPHSSRSMSSSSRAVQSRSEELSYNAASRSEDRVSSHAHAHHHPSFAHGIYGNYAVSSSRYGYGYGYGYGGAMPYAPSHSNGSGMTGGGGSGMSGDYDNSDNSDAETSLSDTDYSDENFDEDVEWETASEFSSYRHQWSRHPDLVLVPPSPSQASTVFREIHRISNSESSACGDNDDDPAASAAAADGSADAPPNSMSSTHSDQSLLASAGGEKLYQFNLFCRTPSLSARPSHQAVQNTGQPQLQQYYLQGHAVDPHHGGGHAMLDDEDDGEDEGGDFPCPVCPNRSYRQKRSLTRHIKSAHGGGYGTCKICCDTNFSQKVSYEKHLFKSQKHLKKLWLIIEKTDSSLNKGDFQVEKPPTNPKKKPKRVFEREKLVVALKRLNLMHYEGVFRDEDILGDADGDADAAAAGDAGSGGGGGVGSAGGDAAAQKPHRAAAEMPSTGDSSGANSSRSRSPDVVAAAGPRPPKKLPQTMAARRAAQVVENANASGLHSLNAAKKQNAGAALGVAKKSGKLKRYAGGTGRRAPPGAAAHGRLAGGSGGGAARSHTSVAAGGGGFLMSEEPAHGGSSSRSRDRSNSSDYAPRVIRQPQPRKRYRDHRSRSPLVDASRRGDSSSFSRSPELPPGSIMSPGGSRRSRATGSGMRRGSVRPMSMSTSWGAMPGGGNAGGGNGMGHLPQHGGGYPGHGGGGGGHFHHHSASSGAAGFRSGVSAARFVSPPTPSSQRSPNAFANPNMSLPHTPSHRSGRSTSSNRSDSPSLSHQIPPIGYGPPSMFLSQAQLMSGRSAQPLAVAPHSHSSSSVRRSLSRRLETLSRADIHSDNRSDASLSSTRLKIRMSHRRPDYNPSSGPFSVYPPPSEPSMSSRSFAASASGATAPHSPARRAHKRHHRVPSTSSGVVPQSFDAAATGFESDVDLDNFLQSDPSALHDIPMLGDESSMPPPMLGDDSSPHSSPPSKPQFSPKFSAAETEPANMPPAAHGLSSVSNSASRINDDRLTGSPASGGSMQQCLSSTSSDTSSNGQVSSRMGKPFQATPEQLYDVPKREVSYQPHELSRASLKNDPSQNDGQWSTSWQHHNSSSVNAAAEAAGVGVGIDDAPNVVGTVRSANAAAQYVTPPNSTHGGTAGHGGDLPLSSTPVLAPASNGGGHMNIDLDERVLSDAYVPALEDNIDKMSECSTSHVGGAAAPMLAAGDDGLRFPTSADAIAATGGDCIELADDPLASIPRQMKVGRSRAQFTLTPPSSFHDDNPTATGGVDGLRHHVRTSAHRSSLVDSRPMKRSKSGILPPMPAAAGAASSSPASALMSAAAASHTFSPPSNSRDRRSAAASSMRNSRSVQNLSSFGGRGFSGFPSPRDISRAAAAYPLSQRQHPHTSPAQELMNSAALSHEDFSTMQRPSLMDFELDDFPPLGDTRLMSPAVPSNTADTMQSNRAHLSIDQGGRGGLGTRLDFDHPSPLYRSRSHVGLANQSSLGGNGGAHGAPTPFGRSAAMAASSQYAAVGSSPSLSHAHHVAHPHRASSGVGVTSPLLPPTNAGARSERASMSSPSFGFARDAAGGSGSSATDPLSHVLFPMDDGAYPNTAGGGMPMGDLRRSSASMEADYVDAFLRSEDFMKRSHAMM